MVAGFIHIIRLLIVFTNRHRTLFSKTWRCGSSWLSTCGPAEARHSSLRPAVLDWIAMGMAGMESALVVVRAATVIAWHRRAFAWYWTRRSRPRGGRPQIGADVRCLVREMAVANPLWGAPRIHGELLNLGFAVPERTVSRLMPRRRMPPSQSWRTFLKNHLGSTIAVDFFAVPTLTCRILFVFVVLAHDRRRILHVDVTRHPSSA